jgi:type III restriction enzyme
MLWAYFFNQISNFLRAKLCFKLNLNDLAKKVFGMANNYLFNELFYDSELEKKNITTNLREVVVFTKIPKNSIKIPVAGGASYSPDFAYVLNYKDGQQKLHFIVETKDTDKGSLRNEERQKIAHAEHFFGKVIQIEFKTQFSTQKITDLIKEIRPKH